MLGNFAAVCGTGCPGVYFPQGKRRGVLGTQFWAGAGKGRVYLLCGFRRPCAAAVSGMAVRCFVQLRYPHCHVPLPQHTGKRDSVDGDGVPGTAENHDGKLLVDAGMERRALLADADPPGDAAGCPL